MEIVVCENKHELGKRASCKGAELINAALAEKNEANIVVATGTSQFEMLNCLVREKVAWENVTAFHLDEYIGLSILHPGSFRRYLKERFVDKVPLNEFVYVNGESDPIRECGRLGRLIAAIEIDVAFVGIGENGHLAFNDPPADFGIEEPYLVVDLDLGCRQQQLGEGWFNTLDEVPVRAISMSIRQILKSKAIVCSAPDLRKALAVKRTVRGAIVPEVPASALNLHSNTWMYLDGDSASLLQNRA